MLKHSSIWLLLSEKTPLKTRSCLCSQGASLGQQPQKLLSDRERPYSIIISPSEGILSDLKIMKKKKKKLGKKIERRKKQPKRRKDQE